MRVLCVLAGALLVIQAGGAFASETVVESPEAAYTKAASPGPALQDAIDRILIHTIALEEARRILLLDRCDVSRPTNKAQRPDVAALAEAIVGRRIEMARSPDTQAGAMRALIQRLDFLSRPVADSQKLTAFLGTPEGARAKQASDKEGAVLLLDNRLFDASTGISWYWPVSRLLQVASDGGWRDELLAALDAATPGAAAAALAASPDPTIATPEDAAKVLESVSWEAVAQQLQQRYPADLHAAREKLDGLGYAYRRIDVRKGMATMWTVLPGVAADWTDRSAKACAIARGQPCEVEAVRELARMALAALEIDDFSAIRAVARTYLTDSCTLTAPK